MTDLRQWINMAAGLMMLGEAADNPLRQVKVADIDIDAAAHHFGLPITDQYATGTSMRRVLNASKRELLALFGKQSTISVYRALDIPIGELDTSDVGIAWAWNIEGALHGSGLSRGGKSGIVLAGSVAAAEVNWEVTVAVNAFHEDEAEIVLFDGATVTLDMVYAVQGHRVGEAITSPNLKGAQVTA